MLSVLSKIYARVMAVRNGLYDNGVFETHDLGARTISIGNITTGGTGKTPLVAYVAEILAERGETVCILTRGYGRKDSKKRVLVSDGSTILSNPANSGDEPFELAQKLLGKAIVIADANRVSAAQWAKRKFGVTVFVLDDGFQHRRAKRDLDIVCVDATSPGGYSQAGSLRSGGMLPAGRLREPLHNLRRADVVVITRADLVNDISNLRAEISDLNVNATIFVTNSPIVAVEELGEFHRAGNVQGVSKKRLPVNWDSLRNGDGQNEGETRVSAFCALGNPDSFFTQLLRAFEEEGMEDFDLSITKPFPDHHSYSQKDIDDLYKQAEVSGIDAFVTTAKDAVKLSNLKFEIPCFVAEIEVQIDDPSAFAALL